MSFLNRFPKRWFTINGKQELLTNVCRRVTIPSAVKSQSHLYLSHTIRDGDRPDLLCEKLYDNPDYWWIILLVNDIHDFYKEWPMTEHDLDDYIEDKYSDPDAIMHYVDDDGHVVDPRPTSFERNITINEAVVFLDIEQVTFREYEEMANNYKRNIKLVDPDYIQVFDKYLDEALDE